MADQSCPQFGSFPTTRWSLIARTRDIDPQLRRRALEELLRRYWPALCAHLVRKRRIDVHSAADLIQGFISDKVLERDLLAQADPAKGRFRSLLLRSLENYVIDQARFEKARKRSAASEVSLDDEHEELAQSAAPASDIFDVAWARLVLNESVNRMRGDCQRTPHIWAVFQCRILVPALNDAPPTPYKELVARLGFASPDQASNALITAKRRFQQALRSVIAEYVEDDAEIDDEIATLRQVLASTRDLSTGVAGSFASALPREVPFGAGLPTPPIAPGAGSSTPTHDGDLPPSDLDQTSAHLLAKMLELNSQRDSLWGPAELGELLNHFLALPLREALHSLDPTQPMSLDPGTLATAPPLKTLADLLGHPQPPLELLSALKRTARNSAKLATSTAPSEIAALFYFASIAAALVRHGQRITKSGDDILRNGFQLMVDRGWVGEQARSLFRQGLRAIDG